MSRIIQHCECQNMQHNNSKPSPLYSELPTHLEQTIYSKKNPKLCTNHTISNTNQCNVCKNYENIEHFLSGSFRPHSCPIDENGESKNLHTIREKYRRKFSKSSLKPDKSKTQDQIYMSKSINSPNQRFDGFNHYINNHSDIPIINETVSEATRVTLRHANTDNNIVFTRTDIKKPSCGLKYIIFQKLSIITHFLTKSKQKHSMKPRQLSDENIFNEKQSVTKRSKSFNTMENRNDIHPCDSDCIGLSDSKVTKMKSHKGKSSDTSYSSTVSIDAHAGSPITIMNRVCSKNLTNDLLLSERNGTMKNERQTQYNTQKLKEYPHKKSHHQHKQSLNRSNVDQHPFCSSHPNYSFPSCLYPFQQPCAPLCHPHCHLQSPIQPPFQPCHYCCCNHSHIVMHLPLSPSPPICCNQSSHYCNCMNSIISSQKQPEQYLNCQYDYRARSTLCNSCQTKPTNRCQSENFDYNRHSSDLPNQCRPCQKISNSNYRYRQKSEIKGRMSKSVASSIPPPPPPPPSSLYSMTSAIQHRSKHRKHCHNKMSHSPDCTNNVQNIIYSHLNNSVAACPAPKSDSDRMDQCPDLVYSYTNPVDITRKNMKYVCSKGQIAERSDKEADKYSHQLCSSKRQATDCGNQKETFDRRSAEIIKENTANYRPRFQSKTPETCSNKYDRRHKKHHYDVQKISKHKSISTTREYKFIGNDRFDKDDSLDSPEAGSFIYHPMSPLAQKNIQTLAPKKVSSFNNRQRRNYRDISYGKAESLRKAFQENMLSLKEVGWYWGPLSFIEAESLMENKANGTFLVRDSGHDTYFLSLTFRVRETTYHTRIEYSQGTFSFWSQPESHSATTIVEFIEKAVAHSQSGKFHYFLLTNVPGQPPMEVSLLYPLSRHQIVHSLKHLSRFVILSHIRKDHIAELTVPPVLLSYLLEKQYYISNLEEFIDMTQDAHPLSYQSTL